MQLGMIGLGRMGANMVKRLLRGGHECVVYDHSEKAIDELVADGAKGAVDMQNFVDRLLLGYSWDGGWRRLGGGVDGRHQHRFRERKVYRWAYAPRRRSGRPRCGYLAAVSGNGESEVLLTYL